MGSNTMRGPTSQSDRLLMICFANAEPLGRRLLADLIEAWDPDNHPMTEVIPPTALLDGTVKATGSVVWLVAAADVDSHQLYQTLEELGQHHVPVMLTREGDHGSPADSFQAGVVTAPPTLSGCELLLMLRVLFNQSENLRYIKQELKITRMHHGGLRGQIDKLDEELRLAACVQREFLPQSIPQVEAVEIHVMFQPASYVSGDIYDVQRLDEHHVGFWIADVVGHGVPAALMTMFVKRALPTKEITADGYRIVPPDEALQRLNHEMVNRSSGHVRFATAVYGVIDTRTHQLQLARAGHPFPLLLGEDGSVRSLEPDGPLLGVFADDTFERMDVQMQPGDRLLFYSDGFECAFGTGPGNFKQKDYERSFAHLAEGTFAEALTRLQEDIGALPGSLHQPDDLTAVMVGVRHKVATPDADSIKAPQVNHATAAS